MCYQCVLKAQQMLGCSLWIWASITRHTNFSWLKTLYSSLHCPRQELELCLGSSTLRKNWEEHLTHFLFPIGILKWQGVIASWNKWQFYNLPVVRGGRAMQQCSTFLQLEEKLRGYFKLIGRIVHMASRYISVIWLIPLCTKIALTNNSSWDWL